MNIKNKKVYPERERVRERRVVRRRDRDSGENEVWRDIQIEWDGVWVGGIKRGSASKRRLRGARGREESRKRTKLKTYIRFNITLKKDEEKVIKKAARRRKIGINKVCIGRFNAYCIKKNKKGTARTVIVIVS